MLKPATVASFSQWVGFGVFKGDHLLFLRDVEEPAMVSYRVPTSHALQVLHRLKMGFFGQID
jgi:hypothetical protein